MQKKSKEKTMKRCPFRADTSSVYSNSTVSIQNVELTTAEMALKMARKPSHTKFEEKSPRKASLSLCKTDTIIPTAKDPKQAAVSLTKLLLRNVRNKKFCIEKILSDRPFSVQKTANTSTQVMLQPTPAQHAADYVRPKIIAMCPNKNVMPPYNSKRIVNFNRTENQRTRCLKNRNDKKQKKLPKLEEEVLITERIVQADNVETSSAGESPAEQHICMDIDLDNPFDLDVHGIDYRNCYKNDEQDLENIREHRKIKRSAERMQETKSIKALNAKMQSLVTNFVDKTKGESPFIELMESPSICSQSVLVGKLKRTERKPRNRLTVQQEEKEEQRDKRYSKLMTEKHKQMEQVKEEEASPNSKRNMVLYLAEADFNRLYLEQSKETMQEASAELPSNRKTYRHTLGEVKRLRHKMKQSKLLLQQKAEVRKQFSTDQGTATCIPEARSDLSKSKETISEESSNDVDNRKVGRIKNKYMLRVFHFRHGKELQGSIPLGRKPPTTMTRNEWLYALLSNERKEEVYRLNSSGTKLDLIRGGRRVKATKVDAMVKPYGSQHKGNVKQEVCVRKPKIQRESKFNLRNSIFGDERTQTNPSSLVHRSPSEATRFFGDLSFYIQNERKSKTALRRQRRQQRMRYLGIPRGKQWKRKDKFGRGINDEPEHLVWSLATYQTVERAETDGENRSDPEISNASTGFDNIELFNQLKEESKSIESCLSSHDSGRFLMQGDKRLSIEYTTKAMVPFEETNRMHIQAVPISTQQMQANPYQTVPFAGQLAEQDRRPSDKFHTFASRLRNDIRDRIYVPTAEKPTKKLALRNGKAYSPKVATDLDETYIELLNHRPAVKIFRPKTAALCMKEAQRKKFVGWCIQQKLVEQVSAEERQIIYHKNVQKMKQVFSDFFVSLQSTYNDELNQIECKLEPLYIKTDLMRKTLQQFEKQLAAVSMNIKYIENTLIKLTMLQNFHFLLMKESWKRTHDWIHRTKNGDLENVCDSVQKRNIVNVRNRDSDNVWAIKEYYENQYEKHPVLICFSDYESFNVAVDDLKSKTFVQLIQLHFVLKLHSTVQHEFDKVLRRAEGCKNERQNMLETKRAKNTLMESRTTYLQSETKGSTSDQLSESVASINFRKIKAFQEVLFDKLVPWSIRQSVKEDIDISERYAMISDGLFDLLGLVDEIPKKLRDSTYMRYRKRLKYDALMSIKAVELENRIQTTMKTVQRLWQPVTVKSRCEVNARFRRMKFKKIPLIQETKDRTVPDKIKFFFKAFYDAKNMPDLTETEQSEIEKNLGGIEEESITFDFDHFLRINDYEPNYNFKTRIELSDGAEANYMKYKELIPYVEEKLAEWESIRKLKIKQHIEENPNLYSDIKT